ncbi:hypothetical protein CCY16_00166 [Wolbachia endosymbiont of Wuchereria bancrofti]|nr:hypothetical protein CCY16_00166 [Wolbachia endosymbiont of Wuchereria bancrofti]
MLVTAHEVSATLIPVGHSVQEKHRILNIVSFFHKIKKELSIASPYL